MIDDCHATGFLGATGRGTHERHGVLGRVDIITGTLGKALGGASGGFIVGARRGRRVAAPAVAALTCSPTPSRR
jgi:7-keto-8-aminopelargonate synthetase-like enzyme